MTLYLDEIRDDIRFAFRQFRRYPKYWGGIMLTLVVGMATATSLFAIVDGLPAGILAAVKRNTAADYTVMGLSLTGYSMPIFWWALLLILFFSVQLGWTPVSGRIAVQYDVPMTTGFMLIDTLRAGDMAAFRSALSHLILPTIALGTIPLAVIARMTRSSMLEVLR